MGKGKWIAVAIGIVAIILILGVGATSRQATVSPQSQPIFKKSPLSVEVTRTIVDGVTAQQGHTIFIYDLDIRNTDNVRHSLSLLVE